MEGWNRHEAERTEVLRGLQEERQSAELMRSKQQEVGNLGHIYSLSFYWFISAIKFVFSDVPTSYSLPSHLTFTFKNGLMNAFEI